MESNKHPMANADLLNSAFTAFKKQFDTKPTGAAFAPGRVNVIGEHTDYNNGFVMPIALEMGTVAVGSLTRSQSSGSDDELCIKVYTMESFTDEPVTISLNYKQQALVPGQWSPAIQPIAKPHWVNYILGSIAAFSDDLLQKCLSEAGPVRSTSGILLNLNVLVSSSVPLGAGLSSSAAVEVASFYLMHALLDKKLPSLEKIALACQQVEHKFANVPCGIMDQMVSAGGQKNNALLIDCRDLSIRYVPLPSKSHAVFVIADTGVRHKLATSEYAVRREQCERASKKLNVPSLREVTRWPPDGSKGFDYQNDIDMKRAWHVVTENERCMLAADEMSSIVGAASETRLEEALTKLGKLMKASHDSLQRDYAVSCAELDRLVAAACKVPGVYGSRMTGGGFGGSTVTLVNPASLDALIPALKNAGAVRIFVVTAADGAHIIPITSAAGLTA